MWSIAKVLLYCANYSIKLQSNDIFVPNRASDDPYSEKEGIKGILWQHCVGVFEGLCFLISQLNIQGHQDFVLNLKPVILLYIWLLILGL